MGRGIAHKLIASHLLEGDPILGGEIGLRIDQTLTQDATGTMVMLEFEQLGVAQVRTEVSAQYVDHNLLQADFRNADDHLFLRSAARKWGLWFSKPGNGVSHPVHMQRFGAPGKTLLGSDSHTCAAGSLGMLAIGTGGLEVALAMAGEPYYVRMPEIWGVRLTGELPNWVSAKDVILEMLRRHGVAGGVGRIVEYHGPGVARLSAMDRHVIANMGAELGATTSMFPSDGEVRRFLASEGREDDWVELLADEDAAYDVAEEIDLSTLEPLIALPSSPGNVKSVREVAGPEISQVVIGSSANPGLRDFEIVAHAVDGRQTPRRGLVRRQPNLPAVARGARPQRRGRQAGRRRRTAQPGRVHGLHRRRPGPGNRRDLPAHRAAQLPRALRHQGRQGLPLLARDGRRLRSDRADHRPTRARNPLPPARPPSEQIVNTRMITAPDPDPDRELRRWPEHRAAPRARAAARPDRGARAARAGRRHLHRRDHARRPSAQPALEHSRPGALHVRADR
jgi:homoaconitase/3-isopropylmalate dehydratase large subunit